MISEVHLIDCMEYMKNIPDKFFELAIVDPPYGININMNMGIKKGQKKRHKIKKWDNEIPKQEYFIELMRISQNQIIWGGNYFYLPPTYHFIFWDKEIPNGMSFSDGEYAWTSFNKAHKKWTFNNITNDKIHPTQKPVQLYKWLLKNYAKPGDKIFDSHGGSMSSVIACIDGGFQIVCCEIDIDYYNAGKKRILNHLDQGNIFMNRPKIIFHP